MDVVGYEKCRVVRFASAFRPQGAPFTPETFAKIIARYSFAKYPTLEDLLKEGPSLFQIGKFQDVQIDEFGIYTDGYSAAGRCSTQALDNFLDDIVGWASEEFGITFILPHRNETHYESNIVVLSSADLASIVRPNAASQAIVEALTKGTGLRYAPSGVVFDCDPVDVSATDRRKKPWRLFIERRSGFPFRENIFLCQAPISTPEYVGVLQALEQVLVETRI
jgi:hypothetical protein